MPGCVLSNLLLFCLSTALTQMLELGYLRSAYVFRFLKSSVITIESRIKDLLNRRSPLWPNPPKCCII
jgi:hypothetical protein